MEDPAQFIVSWSSDSAASANIEDLKKIQGFKRVRKFKLVVGMTLERSKRRDAGEDGTVNSGLALIEFEGDKLPVKEVRGVLGSGGEFGWYRLKRIYSDEK